MKGFVRNEVELHVQIMIRKKTCRKVCIYKMLPYIKILCTQEIRKAQKNIHQFQNSGYQWQVGGTETFFLWGEVLKETKPYL